MGNPTTQVDRWHKYRSYFWFGFVIFCGAFMLIYRSERAAVDAYNVRNAALTAQRQAAVDAMRDKIKDLLARPPAEIEQRLNLPAKPAWVERMKSDSTLTTDNVEKRHYVDPLTGATFGIRYLEGGYYDIPNNEQPAAPGEPWGWWILSLQERETVVLWLVLVVYFFIFSWSRRVVAEMMLAVPVLYLLLSICQRHPTDFEMVTSVSTMLAGSFLLLWLSYKVPFFNPRLCQKCGYDLTGFSVGTPCPGCGLLAGGHHHGFHVAMKERVARGLEEDEMPREETPEPDNDHVEEEPAHETQMPPHDDPPENPRL